MKTTLLALYAVIVTSYLVYAHLGNGNSEKDAQVTRLDLSFLDLKAGSKKDWLGIQSIESYYMEESKKILHGDNLEIEWKLPKAIVVTKRYNQGNLTGTNVMEYDLSPDPPKTY